MGCISTRGFANGMNRNHRYIVLIVKVSFSNYVYVVFMKVFVCNSSFLTFVFQKRAPEREKQSALSKQILMDKEARPVSGEDDFMQYDDVTMGDNEVSVVTYDRLPEKMILCSMMMLLRGIMR